MANKTYGTFYGRGDTDHLIKRVALGDNANRYQILNVTKDRVYRFATLSKVRGAIEKMRGNGDTIATNDHVPDVRFPTGRSFVKADGSVATKKSKKTTNINVTTKRKKSIDVEIVITVNGKKIKL